MGCKKLLYLFTVLVVICGIILAYNEGFRTVREHPQKHSFMVLLTVPDDQGWVCTGTLIDKRRILTAAHCLVDKASLINVNVGVDTLPDTRVNSYQDQLNMTRFLIHEHFDSTTFNNDIALIYLNEDIPANKEISPVALPFEENLSNNRDTSHVVLGWKLNVQDFDDHLLTKSVIIVDTDECNDVAGTILNGNKICAVGTDDVKPCTGDSGGPLLCGNVQIGILSRGLENCTGPAVYTRVEDYLEWIQDHVSPPEKTDSWNGDYGNFVLVVILMLMAMLRLQ